MTATDWLYVQIVGALCVLACGWAALCVADYFVTQILTN